MASLLTPFPALLAAAIVIPAVLLLYFLRLRRSPRTVPSIMFWERAVHDLEANTPFQRLRPSWLLALQLLLLLMLIVALGRPIWGRASTVPEQLILIVDVSASMSASTSTEPNAPTRLDEAKRLASKMVSAPTKSGTNPEVMIIAAGRQARVVHSYSSHTPALQTAIHAIQSTDETAVLSPALELANAFLLARSEGSGTNESDEQTSVPNTRVVVFSDGRFGDDGPIEFAGRDQVEFVNIQEPVTGTTSGLRVFQNVGIVTFSARRAYADPSAIQVLCTVLNSGEDSQQVPLRLLLDDRLIEGRVVEVPGRTDDEAGEASVVFEFDNTVGGVLRAQIIVDQDALLADNVAGMILTPPTQSGVLLVHPDDRQPNSFLLEVLEVLDLRSVQLMTETDYRDLEALPTLEYIRQLAPYELIMFVNASPTEVPPCATLSFGSILPFESDSALKMRESQTLSRRVLSWNRTHPIMTDVNLDPVAIADRKRIALDDSMTVLALGAGGPVIVVLESNKLRHVVVSFDLVQSNWPILPSFAIFLQNAIEYVTLRGQLEAGQAYRPGEPIHIQATDPAVVEFHITGADIDQHIPRSNVASEVDGQSTLPPFAQTGLYTISGATPPTDKVAVSLLSRTESDVQPVDALLINQEPWQTGTTSPPPPRDIWKWFIGFGIALLLLEWWLYTARMPR